MKAYRVLAFLLIHSFLSPPQSAAAATVKSVDNRNDKQALLAFKDNLDHDASIFSSWNGSSSFCKWQGISCCRRHPERVCALNVSYNGLVGSISPYVGNLTFLRILDLSANELSGAIPSTIGHLSRMEKLLLGNNSLTGTFPGILYNCSNLIRLSLAMNQLYGNLPSWLGRFTRLQTLNLLSNHFTGNIPLSVANLSSLQYIWLQENYLGGPIPSGLGQISQIQKISLHTNNLSGTIPKSIFNLTSLSLLYLASNNLQGSLPSDIGTYLFNLKELTLDLNNLTGTIPPSLSNASSIQLIDLGGNNFRGTIPEELGRTCPWYFAIAQNELEAKVAADWKFIDFFSNCSNLQTFELSRNKFGGLLPNSIANFTSQLLHLNFERNYISGQIPSGIENLVGLTLLSFGTNYLTGIIPIGIGRLHNLNEFNLGINDFSGPIPSSIGNLTMLTVFGAQSNHLEGHIPSSIGNLTQLTILALGNNSLSGTLPKSLFQISALSSALDLSYNYLSGMIPDEVSNLKNLAQLVLSRNNLSGNLPAGLERCQTLTNLALDGNTFQGTIPSFLGKLKGLQILNLSNNDFAGVIPEELGLLNGLSELYLARNKLFGNIPLTLVNLTHLSILDISYNNINGPVPKKGVFSNASALMLVGNKMLCGGIPALHLPECLIPHDRKNSLNLLKFGIPIISVILVLALLPLVYIIHNRRKHITRKSTTSYALGDMYPKISYGELAEATQNFAATKLIGVGKYGHVYKGILQFNDKNTLKEETHDVAIKVFDLQQLGSSKSFLAECETLRIVRHRNLIRIRTCCSTIDYNGNDFKALVFDYIPNGNLYNWLHPEETNGQASASRLVLTHRLNIAVDIADALEYLHHNCQPAVIHCDLKPSNILLCEDFSACVGDFGLAKLLPDPISKTLVESESSIGIRGTIGYVPPEYGEGSPVSTTGDVYSFGVLLLEMVTGRNPTEYLFIDGLTLHNFVETAFPERVIDIIDPYFTSYVTESSTFNKMSECFSSIIEIGLTCSKQSPSERMSMKDAAIKLHKIRDEYLANGNC